MSYSTTIQILKQFTLPDWDNLTLMGHLLAFPINKAHKDNQLPHYNK